MSRETLKGNGSVYDGVEILSFSNRTRRDRRLLKRFIDLPRALYKDEPQYIPLLDYEYLGFRLLGVKGLFQRENPFFEHAEIKFYLALCQGEIVGRCIAFVNHDHNRHWKDRVGFFGHFESIDDPRIARALLATAGAWLRSKGMVTLRGPQNLPVNEATPGFLTEGFHTRPVIYYHYNKPFYAGLVKGLGFQPVKKVFSWSYSFPNPLDQKLVRMVHKVIARYGIHIESWKERPLTERKQEMLEIYNDAWSDNWGFVPFRKAVFSKIIDDMKWIMDKHLFTFVYVKGEPAAFLGCVPNILERMAPGKGLRRIELFRALSVVLGGRRIKGARLSYLGVKKKYRRFGLEGVMLGKQQEYWIAKDYEYGDIGWVLEDNARTIRLIEKSLFASPSKTYTVFEIPLNQLD